MGTQISCKSFVSDCKSDIVDTYTARTTCKLSFCKKNSSSLGCNLMFSPCKLLEYPNCWDQDISGIFIFVHCYKGVKANLSDAAILWTSRIISIF